MIHGTRNIVVLDYSFCVLQGLVYLKKKEVYGDTIINKRWYSPYYIDGEKIKAHFTNKGVGAMDALCGEIDSVPIHLSAKK